MIQKKICLLGSFAVGKTSLVSQFVTGVFSDEYLTTVGVRVDKKSVVVGAEQVEMLIWDIHGDDKFQRVRDLYIRGASGYVLVIDGTRADTITSAIEMNSRAANLLNDAPFLVFLNKHDKQSEWQITSEHREFFRNRSWQVMNTSAKTGESVEAGFLQLAEMMLERS